MIATTSGGLLDGRVRYVQPANGFRSGVEPVLLAAAVPAAPGQRVVEGGSGAGAALLCLAARVPGLRGTGLEIDPELVGIARANAAANLLPDLAFLAADVVSPPSGIGLFDHALANPPYHPGDGAASPDASRERAKRARGSTLRDWIAALAGLLERRGTLTLIVGAAAVGACIPALDAASCGSIALHPLWPRAGAPAKLALIQAVRHGRGAMRLLPGMALHRADGAFTAEADAVLRDGAPIRL